MPDKIKGFVFLYFVPLGISGWAVAQFSLLNPAPESLGCFAQGSFAFRAAMAIRGFVPLDSFQIPNLYHSIPFTATFCRHCCDSLQWAKNILHSCRGKNHPAEWAINSPECGHGCHCPCCALVHFTLWCAHRAGCELSKTAFDAQPCCNTSLEESPEITPLWCSL